MSTKRDLTRISHHTKIVATLGPASSDVDLLEQMIRVGLNVVRFNFSHGTPEFHEENARKVREASQRAGLEVAIIADLQGPKIRVGKIAGGKFELKEGDSLVFDAAFEGEGTKERVGLDYRDLPNDVTEGDTLLLDDGLLTVTVTKVNGSEIHTRVENDAVLKSNKGINKLGGGLSSPALTEKDINDLKTALAIGADYIAISFVKSASDVELARRGQARLDRAPRGAPARQRRDERARHPPAVGRLPLRLPRGDRALSPPPRRGRLPRGHGRRPRAPRLAPPCLRRAPRRHRQRRHAGALRSHPPRRALHRPRPHHR